MEEMQEPEKKTKETQRRKENGINFKISKKNWMNQKN